MSILLLYYRNFANKNLFLNTIIQLISYTPTLPI